MATTTGGYFDPLRREWPDRPTATRWDRRLECDPRYARACADYRLWLTQDGW